jgi:ABC-2 type transport system permease protein
MKILALAKKEARDILQNRIYLLVVLVQVFIIIGAFGLVFAASLASDPGLLDHFGATSAIKIGLPQSLNGSNLAKDLEDQKLGLNYYNNITDAKKFLGNDLVAVIDISPSGEVLVQADTSNVFYSVALTKINEAIKKFKTNRTLVNAGIKQSQIDTIETPVKFKEININQNEKVPIALDSGYFVEVMYGFMVPFILLLPFFLASNIVTDSVVGEKERKTFEVILMTPLSSYMVIIGKIIPILLFSLIQSVAWILLLDILRVPIYNPILLLLMLFFIGLGFIGVGILISMLVDSTKEANSAITLLLVFVTFVLFVPLFIKFNFLEEILNFIPTVIMVKLASSPKISIQIILYSLPTLIISLLIFLVTVRLFRHERTIRL